MLTGSGIREYRLKVCIHVFLLQNIEFKSVKMLYDGGWSVRIHTSKSRVARKILHQTANDFIHLILVIGTSLFCRYLCRKCNDKRLGCNVCVILAQTQDLKKEKLYYVLNRDAIYWCSVQ